MEFGLFIMPSHPPERNLRAGHEWDLQMIRWADEYGLLEVWTGEHHTEVWEPNPAPEVMMAQAILITKNIRIGSGAFLLPYYHPVALAHKIAFLDHISGGRINVGVAPGALPMDMEMFGSNSQQNREQFDEALDGSEANAGNHWSLRSQGEVLFGLASGVRKRRSPRAASSSIAGSTTAHCDGWRTRCRL